MAHTTPSTRDPKSTLLDNFGQHSRLIGFVSSRKECWSWSPLLPPAHRDTHHIMCSCVQQYLLSNFHLPDNFEYSSSKTKCLPLKSLHSGERKRQQTNTTLCQVEAHAMKQMSARARDGWEHHLGDLSQNVAFDQRSQEGTGKAMQVAS